jgi:hypothetical protein
VTINDPPDRPINQAAIDWAFMEAPVPVPTPEGYPSAPVVAITLTVLSAFCDDDGRVEISIAELSKFTDLSVRSIQRVVPYLVELGLVEHDGDNYRVFYKRGMH